ncbi:MAG TPA: NADP-dependent oxidoreductase [Burkholderiales bacterium]|nr:NADP-dependent oxidoreductase [Burkholderiales bacterium]
MSNMTAVRVHQYGGVDALKIEDAPRPQPGPGEVLIRVQASSVNPVDWKIRAGYFKDFMPMPLPYVPGRDVSGVVQAVGAGVASFKKGDEVYGVINGAYAQYAIAKESEIARKPRLVDHVRAAAIPLAASTAWQALFDKGHLEPGQTVLIHGAAGGVGSFAVQLARWKGARVIATASGRNQAYLQELRVDQAIDYDKVRFDEVVRDVDVVLDTIGGKTQTDSYKALRRGGVLVSVAAPPDAGEAAKHGVRAEFLATQSNAELLATIADLVDAGKVRPIVNSVLPLAEVRRAHQLSEGGHVHGKILLKVD